MTDEQPVSEGQERVAALQGLRQVVESAVEIPARQRVADYYRIRWGYAEHNEQTWDAADRALEAMRPEIEQVLFEHDAAQATADTIAQQLEDLRDDVLGDDSLHVLEVAFAAGREVERLTAEVERLRKRVHDVVDETQRRFAPYQSRCDKFDVWSKWAREMYERVGGRWGNESEATRLVVRSLIEEREEWERAAEAETQGRQVEVSRLREQLATATLLPDNAETLISQWLLDHNGTTYGDYHETRPAARDMIAFVLQWGVSVAPVSESVPATAQQDEDEHAPTLAALRDQHRRYTRTSEGRPSGSGAAAPRPHEAVVENALSDALTDQYGFLPLNVRYGAAKAAREIAEQWLDSFTGPEDAVQAARSEATPEVLPSSPPSGGDSDTTPRRWTAGDPEPTGDVTVRSGLCDWRRGDNLLWHAYRNGKRVGQHAHTWSSLIAIFDLTEVLPCTEQEEK